MKIYFSVIAVLIFISSASAQNIFRQNTMSLGGNISFSSKSSDGVSDSYNVFIVSPQFDYFIIDNLSLGLLVNIENINRGDYSNTILGFGPNARYYFQLESVNPFVGLAYIYSNEKWGYGDETSYDVTETQFVISAGLEFFISDNLAFEPVVAYKFVNEKLDESLIESQPYYSNGENEQSSKIFEIGLGLKYFIY